jgi:peptide/nickel transport system permease protein
MNKTFTNKSLFGKAMQNSLAKAGLIIIALVFFLAMLAPIIAPYDPNDINIGWALMDLGAMY